MPSLSSRSSFWFAVSLLLVVGFSEGFQTGQIRPQSLSFSRNSETSPLVLADVDYRAIRRTTRLQNIFGDLFGQQSKEDTAKGPNTVATNKAEAPVVTVIDIPAKVIKIKPLKFYLQLFLVSQQNTPFDGAWFLNANEEVEEYLEVYFSDGTGMISIQFDDLYGMRIQRKGQRPSLQYMLQESVLLHALLDELEAIAFGTDEDAEEVEDEKRLLQFTDENKGILTTAREGLPARAA